MRKNKHSMTTIAFVLALGLLLNVTFFTFSARSSSDVKMINGIGIHEFNLSETGDLVSDGFIEIENKRDYAVIVMVSVSNEILPVDLNLSSKEPRTHKLGLTGDKANVTFYPLPNMSWIELEETTYTIEPHSKTKINYELSFSREELKQQDMDNNSKGFIGYIYIKGEGGSQVNIDYRYKMFLVFEGTLIIPEQNVSTWLLYVLGLALIIIVVAVILVKKLEIVEVEVDKKS